MHQLGGVPPVLRIVQPARGGDDGGGEARRPAGARSPSRKASTFSGWSGQMSPVASATRPTPRNAAWLPQGSPAQNPSTSPSARARAARARRHDGQVQVAVRIEPAEGKPVPQEVVVRGEGEHRRQPHRRPARLGAGAHGGGEGGRGERRRVAPLMEARLVGQRVGKGDGVAVAPDPGPHRHARRNAAEPAGEGDRHRAEQMRPIDRAEGELVADGGPGALFGQSHAQALAGEEAQLLRHQQRGSVGQREVTDTKERRSGQRRAPATPSVGPEADRRWTAGLIIGELVWRTPLRAVPSAAMHHFSARIARRICAKIKQMRPMCLVYCQQAPSPAQEIAKTAFAASASRIPRSIAMRRKRRYASSSVSRRVSISRAFARSMSFRAASVARVDSNSSRNA